MNIKPRVFIGSSVESLSIADAVNLNLDHQVEVTIWRNGTFELSSNTIDSLEEKAKSVDFSIFIFSPDDVVVMRNQQKIAVRDNVVFELGLFIGSLGKSRCFIIKPRGIDLHLPTDLLGLTLADYEPNRSDGDMASAVNHACALIKKQIEKLKPLQRDQKASVVRNFEKKVSTKIEPIDLSVLAELIPTYTSRPYGLSLNEVKSNLNSNNYDADFSTVKLERLGYIEKRNETDYNDNDFFAYRITNDGVDVLMNNKKNIPF